MFDLHASQMQISCFSFQTVVQRNCPEKLCNILVRECSLSLSHIDLHKGGVSVFFCQGRKGSCSVVL